MSKRLRVLVVEDNLADVELVREYMSDSGFISFQIDSVPRLSEAIARLEGESFDLLLIDLGLPDSRGLETFYKLRNAAPNTPAIILTGHDDERTAITAVRSGAQDYLIKGEIIGNTLVRAAQYAVERKLAEDKNQALMIAVQTEKNNLSSLIGSIADEVWFADTQGRFTLANPTALREFNIVPDRLIDVKELAESLEVFRPDGSPRPTEEAPPLRALSGEIIRNQEEIVRTPLNSELRYRQVSAAPVKDSTGRIIGSVSVVRDITESKRAEEVIRRNAEELQAKSDELIRFTYTVSHDLKSPLVTIRTFLGYLEQDIRKPDAGEVDKDLTYIRNAAERASRMLDELLEMSRIGRKVNPPVEVPLQELVKEALDLVAGRIVKRGVSVEVTEEPIQLFGDRPRLVEVFQNLVDNAVKFMGREQDPRVEIGGEQVGEETVLFVRDNGIGIDPQYQPKLFGLFEKLDPGTEGTGIGLALVKRIVEVHGGRLWVESEGPGKGATFRFTLAKTKRKPA
jgi:PAS domain S-box-containing protein